MSILLNRSGGILAACGFCLELAGGFRAVAGVVVCLGIGALSVLFIARFADGCFVVWRCINGVIAMSLFSGP